MTLILTKRFVIFALVWLALSRGAPNGLMFGAVAAALSTWTSLRLLPIDERRIETFAIIKLIPGFIVSSLRGGIDVARRALHPRMPLDRGWIVYRTHLPAGVARVSLGSEMSLLPGSLVAGDGDDRIYVHCLDKGLDVSAQMRREERRIASTLRGGDSMRDTP